MRRIWRTWGALVCLLLPAGSMARAQEANAGKYPPGLIVTAVAKDSPAEQAGLKPGDLLLSLYGKELRFVSQIAPIRDKAVQDGKKVLDVMVRRGAESLTLHLTIALRFGF